jgi:hypothetical protein
MDVSYRLKKASHFCHYKFFVVFGNHYCYPRVILQGMSFSFDEEKVDQKKIG